MTEEELKKCISELCPGDDEEYHLPDDNENVRVYDQPPPENISIPQVTQTQDDATVDPSSSDQPLPGFTSVYASMPSVAHTEENDNDYNTKNM